MSAELSDRFWSKVQRGEDCWLWQGTTNRKGYGYFRVGPVVKRAHRVAFEMASGPIAPGLDVLHHCDTPGCVRPDHLYLGTDVENARDRTERGRVASGLRNGRHTHPETTARGLRSGRAKLSLDAIAEILASDESARSLGRRFGVAHHAISKVRNGTSYKEEVAYVRERRD